MHIILHAPLGFIAFPLVGLPTIRGVSRRGRCCESFPTQGVEKYVVLFHAFFDDCLAGRGENSRPVWHASVVVVDQDVLLAASVVHLVIGILVVAPIDGRVVLRDVRRGLLPRREAQHRSHCNVIQFKTDQFSKTNTLLTG